MIKAPAEINVELRPCGPDDDDFLVEVYASTRAEELALVPWDENQRRAFIQMQFTAQHTHYQSNFPDVAYDVILLNGWRVGRLYVFRNQDEIRILDITMLPKFRNAGIGSRLIRELASEAAAGGKGLRIYVESFNPAHRLFERLGFVKISEREFNDLLEWRSPE